MDHNFWIPLIFRSIPANVMASVHTSSVATCLPNSCMITFGHSIHDVNWTKSVNYVTHTHARPVNIEKSENVWNWMNVIHSKQMAEGISGVIRDFRTLLCNFKAANYQLKRKMQPKLFSSLNLFRILFSHASFVIFLLELCTVNDIYL